MGERMVFNQKFRRGKKFRGSRTAANEKSGGRAGGGGGGFSDSSGAAGAKIEKRNMDALRWLKRWKASRWKRRGNRRGGGFIHQRSFTRPTAAAALLLALMLANIDLPSLSLPTCCSTNQPASSSLSFAAVLCPAESIGLIKFRESSWHALLMKTTNFRPGCRLCLTLADCAGPTLLCNQVPLYFFQSLRKLIIPGC